MADAVITVDLPQHVFQASSGPFSLATFRTRSQSAFRPSQPSFGPVSEQLWSFTMQAAPMSREATIAMEAWFARLAGRNWAFRAWDPLRQLPLGAGNGYRPANDEILFTGSDAVDRSLCSNFRLREGSTTALVAASATRGETTLLIKGLDTALEGQPVLKTGDHFAIGAPGEQNLHMVMADAVCDAAGQARIEFAAPLWKRALMNDLVSFHRPAGRFQLFETDANGSVELVRSAGPLSRGTLVAIEYPWQEQAA